MCAQPHQLNGEIPMTRQAPKARTILWGSAALALGLLTAPIYAQDKPKDHADGPAAA